MMEEFIMANFGREELIFIIKEALKEELAKTMERLNRESDYEELLSMQEACDLLKVSKVTFSRYKKNGLLPYHRLGRRVYFKKEDIMEVIDTKLKYRHRRFDT